MSRTHAVAIFGDEVVLQALNDASARSLDSSEARELADAMQRHSGDTFESWREIVLAFAAAKIDGRFTATVRHIARGSAGALADVAKAERRGKVH